MPIPTYDLFPYYKADLTSENAALLGTAVGLGYKGVLVGCNVVKLGPTSYEVRPGIVVKDGVVIVIRSTVALTIPSTGTHEILLRYEHVNQLPIQQVTIDVYPQGTYDANPIRYVKLGRVQSGTLQLVQPYREYYPNVLFSSSDPSASGSGLSHLVSANTIWYDVNRNHIYRRTSTDWELLVDVSNADMLDGYHAGHSSGQIPISDGVLNTNLNADKLDGYHHSDLLSYQGSVYRDWNNEVVGYSIRVRTSDGAIRYVPSHTNACGCTCTCTCTCTSPCHRDCHVCL